MLGLWLAVWPLSMVAPVPPEVRMIQVAPYLPEGNPFQRVPGHDRAVILVHGLRPHPIITSSADAPYLSSWARPDSALVTALATDSDVYGFGYAQTRAVDELAHAPLLAQSIERIRQLGYSELVLVGYSAGGLIARQYVEDQPEGGGITRVVQVCTPNGGSDWGHLGGTMCDYQAPFIRSLTRAARTERSRERAGKAIPANVEFVCLAGHIGLPTDGTVRCDCQWTKELRDQGVPLVKMLALHMSVMVNPRNVQQIAAVARQSHPRWKPEQVEATRKAWGLD